MKIEIEQAKLRGKFAHYLEKMSDTIRESENLLVGQYTSQSPLNPFLKQLDEKKDQLLSGKFTFLVLGDFNRGKSTFLNVLLGQKALPTNVTACTAIPTFVRYGQETQFKVYYKSGTKKGPMTLKEFQEDYTLSSKSVNDKLKKGLLSIGNLITPIEHAVLECPSPLLGNRVNGQIKDRVEFIDSAGLNHSPEENKRTLNYAESCDAVIFLLSAEQQLTNEEREYLEQYIKGTVGTIFFLINKWDSISYNDDDDDPEELVRGAFITGLSKSLGIAEEEVKKMWGKRIFEISAKSASDKLKSNETLNGTGFPEFTKSLGSFLINDRLKSELEGANIKAKIACSIVKESVNIKLALNCKSLAEIESNIEEAEPHFDDMKSIAKDLKNEVINTKNSCSEEVANSYEAFFKLVIDNFQVDFISQEFEKLNIDSLKKEKRDEFRKNIEQRFADYMREKDKQWNENNQQRVENQRLKLEKKFSQQILDYENKRQKIKNIIIKTQDQKIQQNTNVGASQIESNKQLAMTTSYADPTGKVLASAALGTVGTGAAAYGIAVGTHTTLAWIGAGAIALTPPGWIALGAVATVGVIGGFVGHNWEKNEFKEKMKSELKEKLSDKKNDNKLSEIKDHTKSLFNSFDSVIKQLNDDTNYLEKLLNDSKRDNEAKARNVGEDEKRLLALAANIEFQYNHLDTEYKKIFP